MSMLPFGNGNVWYDPGVNVPLVTGDFVSSVGTPYQYPAIPPEWVMYNTNTANGIPSVEVPSQVLSASFWDLFSSDKPATGDQKNNTEQDQNTQSGLPDSFVLILLVVSIGAALYFTRH